MTKTGGPIRPTDPAACSFCVQGALIRQVYDLGPDHQEFFVFERARENVSERLKRILRSRETYTKNVAQWNDAKHRKKKEVIALLKEALSVKDETP